MVTGLQTTPGEETLGGKGEHPDPGSLAALEEWPQAYLGDQRSGAVPAQGKFIEIDTVLGREEGRLPTANSVASPNSGVVPLIVAFSANASDPDGDALTYAWYFGDPSNGDNTSTVANPGHVYENAGTYTAWLTVTDAYGEDVTDSIIITVSEPQQAASLSTRRANVVEWFWFRVKVRKGAISCRADFDLPMPATDDVISVKFDGIKLFTKPFAKLKQGRNPNVYMMVKRNLLVRINFNTNRIFVFKKKVNIKKFHNANCVSVELVWGDEIAADQFTMNQVSTYRWV